MTDALVGVWLLTSAMLLGAFWLGRWTAGRGAASSRVERAAHAYRAVYLAHGQSVDGVVGPGSTGHIGQVNAMNAFVNVMTEDPS